MSISFDHLLSNYCFCWRCFLLLIFPYWHDFSFILISSNFQTFPISIDLEVRKYSSIIFKGEEFFHEFDLLFDLSNHLLTFSIANFLLLIWGFFAYNLYSFLPISSVELTTILIPFYRYLLAYLFLPLFSSNSLFHCWIRSLFSLPIVHILDENLNLILFLFILQLWHSFAYLEHQTTLIKFMKSKEWP